MTTDLLAPSTRTVTPPPVGSSLRRLQLWGVSLVLVLLTFTQSSGVEAGDTKLDLVVTPWRFLAHATVMWDPTANAGQLQNQAYGYLFPMGPFFLVGHWLALPPWVIQRSWESTLLVVAFLGVVRLARLLGVAGFWPRVVAGLVYALAPRMLMELGTISSELLPVALAPWVLIPLVAGSRDGSPRRAAARSGVAVLLAGGVNAAATLAILPLPALWLLTRARGPRRAALMRWWSASVAFACLWWVIPLLVLGKYSPPFLDWIESASVTTRQTSLATTLRGAEHWEAYLGPGIWPTGYVFVAVRAVVLATALVAAIGVTGLLSRRVPHRQFLTLGVGLGLVLLTFGHTASSLGPLVAGHEQHALDGALAAFRNIHKFDPVLRLPVALGVGHAAAAIARRLDRPKATVSARELAQRRWLAVLAAAALGVVAVAPAITGQIVPQTRALNLPSWWSQTGAWLGQQSGGGRALVVPGASTPVYLWGSPVDDALQPVADGPWTVRNSTPLAQPGYIRLLDAIETQFASGEHDSTLAALLARSGIRYVVVRNDLDPAASHTVSPLFVTQTLRNSPGFRLVAHFGAGTPTSDPNRITDLGATNLPGAVTIFTDTEWTGQLAVDAASNVVNANGSADELPDLVAAGVRSDQPVLFGNAGLSGAGLSILDDGVRRREFGFGGIDSYSDTLTSTQPFGAARTVHDYLPSPAPALSTVAYEGVAGIRASSSGADVNALVNRGVDNGPFSAVDGDASTAWRPGALGGAVNQWLQVDLLNPVTVDTVSVSFVGTGRGTPDRVRVQTSSGSRVDTVTPDELPQPLTLPVGPTSFVRITILHVEDGSVGGTAGIGELSIPGVGVSRTLEVPQSASPDLMTFSAASGQRSACLTVRGAAACSPTWAVAGEEDNAVDRSVDLSAAGTYSASARVRLQPDVAVARLLDARSPISAIASSTDSSDPRERPGAAVDGDPTTGWVAARSDAHPDLRLTLARPVRLRGFRLRPAIAAPAAAPVRLLIGVNGRLLHRHVPADGVVRFHRSITTRTLSIEVTRATARISTSTADGTQVFLPVGIGEVTLLGRRAPTATPARSLTIPCRRGPVLVVDGVPVTMSVEGSMTAALQGLPLTATPCASGRSLLQLNAGENRFTLAATGLVRPQSLQLLNQQNSLTTLAALTPTAAVSDPAPPRLVHWGATDRSVAVSAPVASLLIVHENANAGWRATVGGHRLRATTVDGWQQAWLLPAGTSGVVHLVYAPQRTVSLGLIAGGAAALLLLVLALWRPGSRKAARPALADAALSPPVVVTVVVLASLLLGSAIGLAIAVAVLAVGRFIRDRGRWAAWCVAATLGLVVGAEFVAPQNSGHPLAGSVGVQGLCLLAVAVVLANGLTARRTPPGLGEPP